MLLLCKRLILDLFEQFMNVYALCTRVRAIYKQIFGHISGNLRHGWSTIIRGYTTETSWTVHNFVIPLRKSS